MHGLATKVKLIWVRTHSKRHGCRHRFARHAVRGRFPVISDTWGPAQSATRLAFPCWKAGRHLQYQTDENQRGRPGQPGLVRVHLLGPYPQPIVPIPAHTLQHTNALPHSRSRQRPGQSLLTSPKLETSPFTPSHPTIPPIPPACQPANSLLHAVLAGLPA